MSFPFDHSTGQTYRTGHIIRVQPSNLALQTYNKQSEMDILTDVIHAILQQKDVNRTIQRVPNSNLKQMLIKLNNDYSYSKCNNGNIIDRQTTLMTKTNWLLTTLQQMTSPSLFNPNVKVLGDQIRQIDLPLIHKVIQMTNQSKVYTDITKHKQVNWVQISRVLPADSYAFLDSFNSKWKNLSNKQLRFADLEKLTNQNINLKHQLELSKIQNEKKLEYNENKSRIQQKSPNCFQQQEQKINIINSQPIKNNRFVRSKESQKCIQYETKNHLKYNYIQKIGQNKAENSYVNLGPRVLKDGLLKGKNESLLQEQNKQLNNLQAKYSHDMCNAEKMLEQANRKIHSLQQSLAKQKQLSKCLMEGSQRYRQKYQQQQNKVTTLKSLELQLKTKDTELKILQKQKQDRQQKYLSTLKNSCALEKRINELKQQVQQKQIIKQRMNEIQKESQQTIKQFQEQLQAQAKIKQSLLREKEKTSNQLQQSLSKIYQMEITLSQKQIQLRARTSQSQKNRKQLQQLRDLTKQQKRQEHKKNQASELSKIEIECLKNNITEVEQRYKKNTDQLNMDLLYEKQRNKSLSQKLNELEKVKANETEYLLKINQLQIKGHELQQSSQLIFDQNINLNSQLSQAKKLLVEANKLLGQKNQQVKMAQRTALDQKRNCEQAEKKIKETEKNLSLQMLKLQKSIHMLQGQNEQLQANIRKLSQRLSIQEQRNKQLQKEKQKMQIQPKNSPKQIKFDEFQQQRQQIQSSRIKVESGLLSQIQELQNKLIEVERQLSLTKVQLNRENLQKLQLQKKLQDEQHEKAFLQRELTEVKKQQQYFNQRRIQQLRQKDSINDKKLKEIQAKSTALQQDLKEKKRVISELLNQIQQYKNQQREQMNKQLEQYKSLKEKSVQAQKQQQVIEKLQKNQKRLAEENRNLSERLKLNTIELSNSLRQTQQLNKRLQESARKQLLNQSIAQQLRSQIQIQQSSFNNLKTELLHKKFQVEKKDKKINEYDQQLKKCKQATDLYQQQKNKAVSLSVQLKSAKEEIQRLQQKQRESEKRLSPTILKNQKEKQELKSQMQKFRQDNKGYQNTLKKINFQFQTCSRNTKEIIAKHQADIQDKNRQIFVLTQEITLSKNRSKDLQASYQRLRTKNDNLQGALFNKQKELISQKQKYEKSMKILNEENEKLKKKIASTRQQADQLQNQLDLLHGMDRSRIQQQRQGRVDQLSVALKQKQQQISKLSAQIEHQQISLKQKDVITRQQSGQIEKLTAALNFRQGQFKTIRNSYELQLKERQQLVRQMHQELEKKRNNKSQPITMGNEDITADLLFQNDVLEGEIQQKKFLKKTIEQHMRCTIIKSRLLYRYDQLNKINFHRYIDKKENLVLIVKMSNGNCIAGYSEGWFQQMKASDREGIIMNLTRKEVFYLVERNRRAISYDDYYIIFGNSQIRLRSQQNVVFSNFGISNSYYNSRGKRVNDFLGGKPNEREIQFQTYEIYQLEMDM